MKFCNLKKILSGLGIFVATTGQAFPNLIHVSNEDENIARRAAQTCIRMASEADMQTYAANMSIRVDKNKGEAVIIGQKGNMTSACRIKFDGDGKFKSKTLIGIEKEKNEIVFVYPDLVDNGTPGAYTVACQVGKNGGTDFANDGTASIFPSVSCKIKAQEPEKNAATEPRSTDAKEQN